MAKQKLTAWFPATVQPVHLGVYERELPYPDSFSFWTGTYWLWSARTPKNAATSRGTSVHQGVPWRGLAEKPQ